MDLGTVKRRMDARIYADPEEFARDVRLIFTNCYRYVGKISDIKSSNVSRSGIPSNTKARQPM